ncbi:MAG: hypothetical protein KGH94_04105 [Candidatus Micrarchaeota archaeon]|nr:hypothetical protein [Candidatus Micrarchaeota archaeon]
MSSKARPYVGVCGVASVDEARGVIAIIRNSGFSLGTEHIPMMGFQVSWRSLDFGFSEGNKRVPRFQELPLILGEVKGEVFSTLHYYTKRPEQLVGEVKRLLEHGGIYSNGLVDGVQLNRVFPHRVEIEELKDKYPRLKIVLQVYPESDSVQQLAKTLANDYKQLDYLILDYSQGRGVELDTMKIAETYQRFRDSGVTSGITFAGGFTGDNVRAKVAQLKRAVGSDDFSIDAEGGLRDKLGEGYGNDALNLEKVRSFLREAREAF